MAVKKKAKSAAKGRSSRSRRVRKASATTAESAAASSGSTIVPRANVGAAVQAAIAFENASLVTATATDAAAAQFRIDWQ
jgi:hypothetical protein